jgi:RNA polymerase sigma-70 factor, ECF subfamily
MIASSAQTFLDPAFPRARPGPILVPVAPAAQPRPQIRTPEPVTPTQGHLRKELVALLPRLRRFAVSLTRNTADADDLVQEACMRAITASDSWDPTLGLDRWVFRILRNLWIGELRKRQVRLGKGHVAADETDELRHETTGEDHLVLKQLMGRLADLPSSHAAVLLLVAVEGYSYKEAADMLDVPQGTIMSRLFRARQMLAEQLAATARVT